MGLQCQMPGMMAQSRQDFWQCMAAVGGAHAQPSCRLGRGLAGGKPGGHVVGRGAKGRSAVLRCRTQAGRSPRGAARRLLGDRLKVRRQRSGRVRRAPAGGLRRSGRRVAGASVSSPAARPEVSARLSAGARGTAVTAAACSALHGMRTSVHCGGSDNGRSRRTCAHGADTKERPAAVRKADAKAVPAAAAANARAVPPRRQGRGRTCGHGPRLAARHAAARRRGAAGRLLHSPPPHFGDRPARRQGGRRPV